MQFSPPYPVNIPAAFSVSSKSIRQIGLWIGHFPELGVGIRGLVVITSPRKRKDNRQLGQNDYRHLNHWVTFRLPPYLSVA
jgi:hypothetical protein